MEISYSFLILTAFGLGIRHGFDLDHLATIDSITKNMDNQPYLAKAVGFLFSLGHGLIIILLSSIIGLGLFKNNFPHWLEGFGDLVSIFFLFTFGISNLYITFKQSKTRPIYLKGIFAKYLLTKTTQPLLIVLIGALFALSFDTFTQVSLFSLEAAAMHSWLFSGILGFIFMFGMMVSDGINGFLVGVLLTNIHKKSYIISKGLGIGIAFFSLVICTMNLIKLIA
ncbi:MAG TPA: DNA repair protein [Gammaproteobacteria bacterium]|nr:DNA repair protein [Gammaproteobacteria bacterium]